MTVAHLGPDSGRAPHKLFACSLALSSRRRSHHRRILRRRGHHRIRHRRHHRIRRRRSRLQGQQVGVRCLSLD